MLHIVICPNCENTVHVRCDNVPNPFELIHADNIARILYKTDQHPQIIPPNAPTVSQLKLMFLLHIIGQELPDFEMSNGVPGTISTYVDEADIDQILQILIQALGRWDVLCDNEIKNNTTLV